MRRTARIEASARHCLCFTLAAWALGSGALASCASGADPLTAPDAGADAATPPRTMEDAGPASGGDAGANGGDDDAADAASYGQDTSSNDDFDVASGQNDDAPALDDDVFVGGFDAYVSDDTGVVSSNDSGGAAVPCGGIPAWFAGTTATEVQNFGTKYTCIVEGWCSESNANGVAAYEPGTGWAWQQAWTAAGACSAGSADDGGS